MQRTSSDHNDDAPADSVDIEHTSLDELINEIDLEPFSVDELLAATDPGITRMPGTEHLALAQNRKPSYLPAGVVRGVSLSALLQMLHLERKSCMLDVAGGGGTGTLTLVNGELADAETDGLSGAEAVYHMLSWHRSQATIMEGGSLFRQTVTMPIPQLLMEAVRRQDEGMGQSPAAGVHTAGASSAVPDADLASEQESWNRLTETLVINGAPIAAVVSGPAEQVLALANESGRIAIDPTSLSLGSLTPVLRLARQWPIVMGPTVEEVILRIEGRQILVRPLDHRRSLFACAAIESTVTLELARHAIISADR